VPVSLFDQLIEEEGPGVFSLPGRWIVETSSCSIFPFRQKVKRAHFTPLHLHPKPFDLLFATSRFRLGTFSAAHRIGENRIYAPCFSEVIATI